MKKLHFLILGVLLAGITMFSSCSKDSTDPTVDQKPTLTFQVGTGYTSANATMPVGTSIKIGIRASANTSSGSKLVDMQMTRTYNGGSQTYDTTLNNLTNFNVDFITKANTQAGDETFIFTIKDKSGQVNTLSIMITTTPVSNPINAFSMKILGAQGSATGSSFASIDGTVYNLADAKANSAKVDLMYYYGATDLATIAAPDDDHALTIFTGTSGLQNWVTKNATKFKLITDAVDFAAIADDAVIVAQTASGVDQSRLPALASGKLIAFITASGKKGILKVESITGQDAGSMTISVKVQQ